MDSDADDWTPSSTRLEIRELLADDDKFLKDLSHPESSIDFYDPIQDLKYEKWLSESHSKVSTVLSCPKCFTSVCYDSEEHSSSFLASETCHTSVGTSYHKAEDSIYLSVSCSICACDLGVFDPNTDTYHLFHVLSGSG